MNKEDLYKLLSECPTLQDKLWLINLQMYLEQEERK